MLVLIYSPDSMKRTCIFIFITFLTAVPLFSMTIEELAGSNEWHNLLLDDPYGQGFVTDDSRFFACGERDYFNEINYLLDNQSTALYNKYPARYECISRNLNIDIPYLENNPELIKYLADNDYDRLSIGIAEPYNKQAMSFFGHAFMFLSNDGESVGDGVSINLFAYVDELSGTETIVKGLQGDLVGYFDFKSVSKMFENYSINLERLVIDYRLNLDRRAIRRVLLMVWDLRDAPIDYQFVARNCVNGTLALLDYAVGNSDMRGRYPGILLPCVMSDIIYDFDLVESVTKYSPVITQMDHEIADDRIPEFDIRKTAWTEDGWPTGIDTGLPPYVPVPDQIERRVYFNNYPSYFELGGSVKPSGEYRISLDCRFLLADEWERVFSAKKLSKLTLGRVKLFYADKNNWGLDRLDLWESAEFPKLMKYHIYPTKRFYIGAHREFKDNCLKPVITMGRGLSVGTDNLLLFAMLDGDLVFDWLGGNLGGEAGLLLNGGWGMLGLNAYYPFIAFPEHSMRKPKLGLTGRLRLTDYFMLGFEYNIFETSLGLSTRVSFSPWG